MRRVGLASLAVLALLALSPGARAAPYGYAEAQAEFDNTLSLSSRLAIQTWLIAGGYTNAVPFEHFSTRTFKAVQQFQTEIGRSPDGRLDVAAIKQLSASIRPELALWGLKKVGLPGRSAYTWVPLGLGLDGQSNGTGLHFADPQKRLWLDFVSVPNRTIEAIWAEMLAQEARQSATVHWKVMKDGWFVISATTPDGHDHYYRYHQDGDAVTGFALEWDNAAGDVHGERIAVLASGALKASLDGADYVNPPYAPPAQQQEASREIAPPPAAPAPEKKTVVHTGTGFFVSDEGHLVTNAHVVAECSEVMVKLDDGTTHEAARTATDSVNDLAILKLDVTPKRVAPLRIGTRLGEGVEAFGFPHSDVLSSSGNFTLGNVTALTGLHDDTRMLQISAPVQAGNSGGPLLDGAGNLIGVVSSKLDAVRMASNSGDLPQNVNFAVKSAIVANFLDANRVTYKVGLATGNPMEPADIADRARAMSGFVVCR